MKPPSSVLIVDANIILSCALGLRGGDVLNFVGLRRLLTMSVHGVKEIENVAMRLVENGNPTALIALQLIEDVKIVADAEYSALVPEAAKTLMLAPASRNGNSSDAHILALAWQTDADIWSHDRDFAGTGWPSWSSANLRAALARETQPRDD